MKKISKKAKKISETLEGVLYIKIGLYTMSLTKEEIYEFMTEGKLIVKDGEKLLCKVE
jgi:uncharacterized protein (UPF0264 family)